MKPSAQELLCHAGRNALGVRVREMRVALDHLRVGNPLLREREVAGILGLSVRTLQEWRRSGDGPPFLKLSRKKRGMVRYDPADVEAYMRRRKVGGSEESDGDAIVR